MIDTKDLSSEVIPGQQEVFANYGSVLPAGVYFVTMGDTTHIKMTSGRNKKGHPFTKLSGLTLRVVGDKNNEESKGTPIGQTLRFQDSWIETIVNCIYTKTQIAESDGMPLSETAQAAFLDQLATDKTPFKVKVDWKAFDTDTYNAILVDVTKTEDRDDPVKMAKEVSTQAQRDEAAAAATLARTYSDFPRNAKGVYIGSIKTADGSEVRAQANVVRYFLATAPAPEVTVED